MTVKQRDVATFRAHAVGADIVEFDADAVYPFRIGLGGGERLFQLLVVDDAAFFEIDEEHLAGLQTPLLDDIFFGDGQTTALRTHDHQIITGDDVARGAQAIAIQRGADLAAIGKRNRCRAVPRLHHRRVIFVKRAPRRVHQRVAFPRLGDHHHHRMRDGITGHYQQLQRVIERCRIGLPRINQWPQLVQISAEDGAGNRPLPRADPVYIAAQRVDLTVVRDHAEGVRQIPRGERVGRKTLMDQCQRRHHARILQVLVIRADLLGQQHAFVDHGARRHRRHIKLLAVLQLQRLHRVAGDLANDVELALQRIGHRHARAALDKHLADHRLDLLHRLAEVLRIARHIAPANQHLAFILDRALNLVFAGQARGRLARQKHHAHAVLAEWRQLDALLRHLLAEKLIRNLYQNACAIRCLGVSSYRAAMRKIVEDSEPLLNDLVALFALDIRHKTDATSVVLIRRVIQPLRGRRVRGVHTVHGKDLA